jgi:monoamine oxidase
VISTLPLGALQSIDTSNCNFSIPKRILIRSLMYSQGIKIGLKFKNKWWLKHGLEIDGSQTSTDLPIRTTVYPSLTIPQDTEAKTDFIESPGVLIVSYCWAQDAGRLSALSEADVINLCLANLETIHNAQQPTNDVIPIRTLYTGEYKIYNWYEKEFSKGLAPSFAPGQFATSYQDLLKPEIEFENDDSNKRFYMAGDTCSVNHAWVNGALDAAMRAVKEILKTENRCDLFCKMEKAWGTIAEEPATDIECICDRSGEQPPNAMFPKESIKVKDTYIGFLHP